MGSRLKEALWTLRALLLLHWHITSLKGADGVWGGDRTDDGTPFVARDKMQHLALGIFTLRAFLHWVDATFIVAMLVVFAVSLMTELLEGWRYLRYGFTRMLCDIPDVTDVLVTMLGGLLAWVLF